MPFPQLTTRMFYGTYEFAPVPLMTWTTELVRSAQDESLSLRRTIGLEGQLLGFPPVCESGNFPGLMAQREALHDAVTTSGQEFRITHEGIHQVSGIFPTLETLEFAAGTWATEIPYAIEFSYKEEIDGNAVDSFSEVWEFEELEDRVSYSARHTISAVGTNTAPSGNNNALENARNFVLARTGFNNIPAGHPAFVQASGAASGIGALDAYEELRSESVDVQAGSVTVNEAFTVSSGCFTHIQDGSFSTDEQGITTVQINGNIQGLGRTPLRFSRALDSYNNFIEPLLIPKANGIYTQFGGSGTLVTANPRSLSFSQNESAGTLTYTRTYNDDPASNLPPDIQDASLSVQVSEPVQLHATIPIPERSVGPIVQDVGTTTPGTYTISGNAVGKTGVSIATVKAFVQTQINANLPVAATLNAQTIILTQKSVTTDEFRR